MKKSLPLWILLTAIPLLLQAEETAAHSTNPQLSGQDPAVVRELQNLEQKRAEAFARRDVEFIDRTTAAECTFVHSAGDIQTKAHELDALKSSELTYNTNHLDEVTVRIYGNIAVLTGLGSKQGVRAGVTFIGQTRFTRVYVKRDGRWQMVASQTAVVGK